MDHQAHLGRPDLSSTWGLRDCAAVLCVTESSAAPFQASLCQTPAAPLPQSLLTSPGDPIITSTLMETSRLCHGPLPPFPLLELKTNKERHGGRASQGPRVRDLRVLPSAQKLSSPGRPLGVQERRHHTPRAGGPSLIPGQGARSLMLHLRPSATKESNIKKKGKKLSSPRVGQPCELAVANRLPHFPFMDKLPSSPKPFRDSLLLSGQGCWLSRVTGPQRPDPLLPPSLSPCWSVCQALL